MATFNPLYTGRSSAVEFPELDSIARSQQRTGELQIKGEEMKLNKVLKDKERFQTMLAIDPVAAISTKNATDQAVMLESYNNKWAKKYVDAKGELSFADELEMAKDKSMLQAAQKKIMADQEQYLRAKDVYQRDTRGYYDKQRFQEAEQEYFKSGVLPTDILDVAPQSMTGWLRTAAKGLPTKTVPTVVNGMKVDTKVIDKADAQNLILEGMSEEARLKQVLLDFDNWTKTAPQKEVYALLQDYDKNGNGIISPEESQYAHQGANIADNPIAKWAMNNQAYLDNAMGTQESASKNIPTGRASTSTTPSEARNAGVIGQTQYNAYHDFGNAKVEDFSPNEIRVLNPEGEQVIKPQSPISADLVGYDEEKDEFIFISKGNFQNIYATNKYDPNQPAGTNWRFAVKRVHLPDKYNKMEVLKGGKSVKIGSLPRTSITTTSTPKKKAY
jgi:hypothetical protein